MLPPENQPQVTTEPTTDVIERPTRQFDHRSALYEKRQSILQQKSSEKTTDFLPPLSSEATPPRLAWRQVVQLREENRRLRAELESQHSELQRLLAEHTKLQDGLDSEIAIVHQGYQQEIEQYHNHMRELMEERNAMQRENFELEQRYQDLYHSFQDAVDEGVQEHVSSRALAPIPEMLPAPQNTIELQPLPTQLEAERQLADAVLLKREVESMVTILTNERRETEKERQELYATILSVREQAKQRYRYLQTRLYARWKLTAASTTLGALAGLVVLQFAAMILLHSLTQVVSLALFAPIVICAILSLVLAHPFALLKQVYKNMPKKKKVKHTAV